MGRQREATGARGAGWFADTRNMGPGRPAAWAGQATGHKRRIAKGGRHRCQPPCHRTSAFRSRRTIVPGFGGMRHPRRQGHASFASVTGTVASAPEGASATGPRRPASRLPGAATRPCWIQVPVQSLACHSRLRACFHPRPRPLLAQRFRQKLRSAFAVHLLGASGPACAFPSAGPLLATACAAPSASRSNPGYPRPGFPPPPEGDLGLPDRVSSSLCFGFPLRRFLLTVMRLSSIPGLGKREMAHLPC
jgi:hypothetical protein